MNTLTPEQWFRALADSTRLHALLMLRVQGQLCVCELVHVLEQSQPKVSRHLAQLRDLGLVETERRGQWVYYRISDDLPAWALQILDTLRDAGPLDAFLRPFHRLSSRPPVGCD